MARCGCTAFPTCSCVILGDTSTTTVFGSGAAQAPYEISVVGYPNPRPIGFLYREASIDAAHALTNNVSNVIVPAHGKISIASMWPVVASKLFAPTAGSYLLSAGSIGGPGGGSSTINFLQYRILLNGITVIAANTRGSNDNASGAGTVTTVHRLVAGDYVEFVVYLGIVSGTSTLADSYLEMRWMGL